MRGNELDFYETISRKGRSILNHGGFEFSFERIYDDGDEAWRCKYRDIYGKSYCTGRLKVHGAWREQGGKRYKRGLVRCKEHNHG